MGSYGVDFGSYCVVHSDTCKHLNFFEFNGKKYPIGARVELTEFGEKYVLKDSGYGFRRGNFRLVDHFIDSKGFENWEYIIGRSYETDTPFFVITSKHPDELVGAVLCAAVDESTFVPGELKVEFKQPNLNPKDWEVPGVMTGWARMVLVLIVALIFKDLWIKLVIQFCALLYFSNWRKEKINEAIITQKFNN